MSIVRNFNLYLNAGNGSVPYINVNQYDQGEQWVFTLYKEDGTKYLPSTGAIVGIKADNRGIINTGTVDADGRVVINETQQMTAAAGIAIFELLIDGDSHGTANFLVNVEQRPGDNADLSDSDLSLIQQAVNSAAVIVDVIGDSDPSEVIGEHVDAWLDNHPEATTTVQDGAITAPKINNSLWNKLLVSEEASGNPASFDDGADDVPVSSLKVALEPVQLGSGDPSPSNVRPIYPANNRNQFPTTADGTYTDSGVTVVANNGVYTVTGTATATSYIELSLATSVDLSPATNQFAFLNTVNDGNIEFAVYRDSTRVHYWAMSPQNRVTANWPDTGNEVVNKIRFNFQNGKTYNITISPVLCLAAYPTPTAFTPYQGIMVDVKGKNLLPKLTAGTYSTNNATVVVDDDGTMHLSGTTNASGNVAIIPLAEPLIISQAALDEGLYFHFNNSVANPSVSLNFEDASAHSMISVLMNTENKIFHLDSSTPNLNKNVVVTRIRMYLASGVTISGTVRPMLAMTGEVGTSYEPYTSTSYPYTLGQNVYGGTVDLATGVLTITKHYAKVTSASRNNDHAFYLVTSGATQAKGDQYKGSVYCDRLPSTEVPVGSQALNGIYVNANGALRFQTEASYATAADFITGMGGELNVCYELATPQTIQLTPQEVKTLLGYNNISSSGTVDVIYHADTKLYVDKMTAVDNNIIAPTEEGFTATRNYTVNDLVIVADTLYKVTANIANGGTITPNSNVQQTTLSALIKALS